MQQNEEWATVVTVCALIALTLRVLKTYRLFAANENLVPVNLPFWNMPYARVPTIDTDTQLLRVMLKKYTFTKMHTTQILEYNILIVVSSIRIDSGSVKLFLRFP